MTDRIVPIFLAICCIVLAISLINRPCVLPPVEVSDNGIVPPDLLKSVAKDDPILDRPIEGLKLDDSELDTALVQIASAAKTEITVNWKTLEGAGIDRAAPVHVHLHGGTLRQALNWLAEDVGGADVHLGYSVEGDTVTLSTSEDFYRDLTTEIYNIRPLIEKVQRWSISPSHGQAMTSEEAVDNITRVITNTVSPDAWRSAGGTVGSIREVGGLLIVTQTHEDQREIATLLTRLDAEMKK